MVVSRLRLSLVIIRNKTVTHTHTHTHNHTHTQNHHYHHNLQTTWIPLTLSHHPFLSAIALGGSSRQHLVFAQNWLMQVIAASTGASMYPLEKFTYEVVLTSTEFLAREMEIKWSYSFCFVGFCFQYLFKNAYSIIVSSHLDFSSGVLLVQVVQLYNSTDTAQDWKVNTFIKIKFCYRHTFLDVTFWIDVRLWWVICQPVTPWTGESGGLLRRHWWLIVRMITLAWVIFSVEYIIADFKAIFTLNPKIILSFLIRSNLKSSYLKCRE